MSQSIGISETLISCNFREEDSLNSSQLATSQMLQTFCSQATDIYSLCGMMGASLFASIARVKCSKALSLFIQNPQKAYWIKGGSTLAACLAEATGIHSIPKFLKEGEILGERIEEGWGGWIHTSLTMILMKGTGSVLPPNLVMQHLAQDALMVKLDEVCVNLHLIEGQRGSFIEKMANAEIMSCQMMVSGALTGFCFSEVKIYEAKQELNYQINQRGSSNRRGFLSGLFSTPQEVCEFAVEGGGKLSIPIGAVHSESNPLSKKGSIHSAMMMATSFNPDLLPKTKEKPKEYATRLVEKSKEGDFEAREKSSLEITLAIHQLLLQSRPRFDAVLEELLALTAGMQEGEGILAYEYRIPEMGEKLTLFNTVSTFQPEHWSAVARKTVLSYLDTVASPLGLAVELGSGGGILSLIAKKTGKVSGIIGVDINPSTCPVATLNAAINRISNVHFYPGDLAELGKILISKKADLIFGCIPQLIKRATIGPIHPEEIHRLAGEITARDRADYSPPRGIFEDVFGLSDNAKAIEQARECLTVDGPLILMLSERAGDENLANLFSRRGMHPTVLYEEVIPQAEGMDLRPLAEAESHLGNFRFRFRLGDGTYRSATEAMGIPVSKLSHLLHGVIAYSYQSLAGRAARKVKEVSTRWGYTEDPITEDPRLLNTAKTWLSKQLAHEVSDKVIAIGPNAEAMLEAVLRLSVVPGRTIGVVGEVESATLEKIGEIDRFKFRQLPDNFAQLTATIEAEALEAVILKPSRRILADAKEIETFLKAAEAQKTLVILLEDHPSKANDPSHTLFAAVAKNRDLLQNFVLIQDLRKFGLPVPLSFTVIPDSALYAALIHYADVTYSRVSTATQKFAAHFFESLLSTSPLDEAPMEGSVQRVESDGRMLSDLAKSFRIPAVFESSPTTKPRGEYSNVLDMSFGESEWIPPGNENLIFDPFSSDPEKEIRTTLQVTADYILQTRGDKFDPKRELVMGLGVHPLLQASISGIKQLTRSPVEVLVAIPRYGAYYPTPLTVEGVELIQVRTSSDNRFLLTANDLRLLPPRRPGIKRILMDNFPTNPAGQYYEDVNHLIELAREVDYFLVDEVFGRLDFNNGYFSRSFASTDAAKNKLKNRLIFYGGLSKEFALGGVRFGFAATHNRPLLEIIQRNLITETDPFAMRAAQYFLPRWKELIDSHIKYLKPKANALSSFFSRRGFPVHPPQGGYAIFVDMNRLFEKSSFIEGEQITRENFHDLLMKYAGVKIKSDQWAGVKGHYRFVFSIDNLDEAIQRLEKFFKTAGIGNKNVSRHYYHS